MRFYLLCSKSTPQKAINKLTKIFFCKPSSVYTGTYVSLTTSLKCEFFTSWVMSFRWLNILGVDWVPGWNSHRYSQNEVSRNTEVPLNSYLQNLSDASRFPLTLCNDLNLHSVGELDGLVSQIQVSLPQICYKFIPCWNLLFYVSMVVLYFREWQFTMGQNRTGEKSY